MKKEWLVKTLAMGIAVLFIWASCSSAISIYTKTSMVNNPSEKNKPYVDPNIHLNKHNLPMLKKSLNDFKNSKYYDSEIGNLLEEIIKQIEFEGDVNSKDLENILIKNGRGSEDIYVNCKIKGHACYGFAFTFPLLFLSLLTFFSYMTLESDFIGVGQFLYWEAGPPDWDNQDINITVDNINYTIWHKGIALGFFGLGHIIYRRGYEGSSWILQMTGFASIVIVRSY